MRGHRGGKQEQERLPKTTNKTKKTRLLRAVKGTQEDGAEHVMVPQEMERSADDTSCPRARSEANCVLRLGPCDSFILERTRHNLSNKQLNSHVSTSSCSKHKTKEAKRKSCRCELCGVPIHSIMKTSELQISEDFQLNYVYWKICPVVTRSRLSQLERLSFRLRALNFSCFSPHQPRPALPAAKHSKVGDNVFTHVFAYVHLRMGKQNMIT